MSAFCLTALAFSYHWNISLGCHWKALCAIFPVIIRDHFLSSSAPGSPISWWILGSGRDMKNDRVISMKSFTFFNFVASLLKNELKCLFGGAFYKLKVIPGWRTGNNIIMIGVMPQLSQLYKGVNFLFSSWRSFSYNTNTQATNNKALIFGNAL